MAKEHVVKGKVFTLVIPRDDESCCQRCALEFPKIGCDGAPCGEGYFVEKKEEKIMSNTKKPHIHAEAIKAWADGATVEYFDTFDNEWSIAATPAWEQNTQYRVKAEPTYPETRLTGDELHAFWYNVDSSEYEDFIALSNHVIKEFIVSGQMDEYIKERNN